MTIQKILDELIRIHKIFSFEKYTDKDSQMCTLWATDDPPDILETTEQLDKICEIIEMRIDETHAVEIYDMTLEEAAVALYELYKKR